MPQGEVGCVGQNRTYRLQGSMGGRALLVFLNGNFVWGAMPVSTC